MKKLTFLLLALLAGGVISAKTLRVNNVAGAMAPYTTVTAALEAAADGDVIILEGSPTSYGDFEVTKAVTIQGNGYFLDVNGYGTEGASPATVGTIEVKAENVKVTSLSARSIKLYGSHNVVTRCNTSNIWMGRDSNTGLAVTDCIIHQNFVNIIDGQYDLTSLVNNIQVTNNIILGGDQANQRITGLENCVIKYNTFSVSVGGRGLLDVQNSVIEYNFNGGCNNAGSTNTMVGNISNAECSYTTFDNDKFVKDTIAPLSGNTGAFAGDDPYVLSGVAPGPRVEDLIVPASVEQGQDLKVTVKIGQSK